MSPIERRLLLSIFACIFFGYAMVNCLLFYRRTRRQAAEYKDRPLASFVQSPQYGPTLWLTGAIGAIGFTVASWELILALLAILRGS